MSRVGKSEHGIRNFRHSFTISSKNAKEGLTFVLASVVCKAALSKSKICITTFTNKFISNLFSSGLAFSIIEVRDSFTDVVRRQCIKNIASFLINGDDDRISRQHLRAGSFHLCSLFDQFIEPAGECSDLFLPVGDFNVVVPDCHLGSGTAGEVNLANDSGVVGGVDRNLGLEDLSVDIFLEALDKRLPFFRDILLVGGIGDLSAFGTKFAGFQKFSS